MDKKIIKNIIASFIVGAIGMILSAYFLGNHIATGFFGALMMISILLWVNEITRKPTKHNSSFIQDCYNTECKSNQNNKCKVANEFKMFKCPSKKQS